MHKLLASLSLSLLLACGGGAPAAPEAAAPVASAPAPATAPAAAPTPLEAACVEKADAADGTADKVVHKCAGCGLAMAGSAEHASSHEGVTFHSCSEGCKGKLDADPGGLLAKACAKLP
jgi:YHS domain-containing protein